MTTLDQETYTFPCPACQKPYLSPYKYKTIWCDACKVLFQEGAYPNITIQYIIHMRKCSCNTCQEWADRLESTYNRIHKNVE